MPCGSKKKRANDRQPQKEKTQQTESTQEEIGGFRKNDRKAGGDWFLSEASLLCLSNREYRQTMRKSLSQGKKAPAVKEKSLLEARTLGNPGVPGGAVYHHGRRETTSVDYQPEGQENPYLHRGCGRGRESLLMPSLPG